MITVIETWFFKQELADQALSLMQQQDDLVGENAHNHPGWSGHAHFYQRHDDRTQVLIVYPWRDLAAHKDLCVSEEPLTREFIATKCTKPPHIEYLTELPVEVEHDHDH